ncbi:hypothetical protein KO481_22650 [Nocardia sp. NEAU-G5]|uniref:DUF2007 domain-containing protein n=2 Tax=Nocardia albiluteola TaxID=2842303 RepID=A0ABS6B3H4_9NOCA|nr:hypothetical protein [Nocardia albiluteola]
MLRPHRRARHKHPTGDYGLLTAAATVTSDESARTVCHLLGANGVRATSGPTADATPWGGRILVLVFPEDAPRAYQVLCRHVS